MKKIICLFLMIVLTFQSVNGSGSRGFYSDDYFTNDSTHVGAIMMYFGAAGCSTYTSARPTVSYGWNYVIGISDYFYVSTHGNSSGDSLLMTNTTYYTSSSVPTNVSNCHLVYLSACYSAKTNSGTGKNLAQKFYNNGADNVVGYNDSVDVGESRYYEKRFYYYYVQQGYSISNCLMYAAIDTNTKYGSSASVPSKVVQYGNTNNYF